MEYTIKLLDKDTYIATEAEWMAIANAAEERDEYPSGGYQGFLDSAALWLSNHDSHKERKFLALMQPGHKAAVAVVDATCVLPQGPIEKSYLKVRVMRTTPKIDTRQTGVERLTILNQIAEIYPVVFMQCLVFAKTEMGPSKVKFYANKQATEELFSSFIRMLRQIPASKSTKKGVKILRFQLETYGKWLEIEYQ